MNTTLPALLAVLVLCLHTAAHDSSQCHVAKGCSCAFVGDDVDVSNKSDDCDWRSVGLAGAIGVLSGLLLSGGAAAVYLHCRGKGGTQRGDYGQDTGSHDRPPSTNSSASDTPLTWRPATSSSGSTNIYRHTKVWPGTP
ncbi:uncharacterized protein LOC112570653 [Pomacea canaliculata]|uniref:uncharacterized protein LOC112570653 n=1 Tax=Pomacea canaliculata TaxID=400727 RepID=UPI000D72DA1A|nr:uncharacterized protein LOC112570653 [Pomacea canaliculata]